MNAPRLTPVRQSLSRPMLIMGAEREPVIVSGMLAVTMIFALGHLATTFAGAALWFICLFALQRMAKYDPQLLRVFTRHLNKRVYYPAQAGFAAAPVAVLNHQ